MENVLLVIHMIACAALVVSVLLQRSEGGALGMGGGGTGGLISGRGAAGLLVKVTMGLAATFIITSLVMTRIHADQARAPSEVERELQQRGADQFDPLAIPGAVTVPSPAPDAAATPPPATQQADPLAPVTGAPGTPAPVPPPPENGGSTGQ